MHERSRPASQRLPFSHVEKSPIHKSELNTFKRLHKKWGDTGTIDCESQQPVCEAGSGLSQLMGNANERSVSQAPPLSWTSVPKSGLQGGACYCLGFSATNPLLVAGTYALSKKLGDGRGRGLPS